MTAASVATLEAWAARTAATMAPPTPEQAARLVVLLVKTTPAGAVRRAA